MTQSELLGWREFYRLHPFDDEDRLYRPAALIAASLGGGELDEHLAWLSRRPSPTAGFSEADLVTMRTSGVRPPKRT
jgi:hypothetical protein